jgi:hypothetical protein
MFSGMENLSVHFGPLQNLYSRGFHRRTGKKLSRRVFDADVVPELVQPCDELLDGVASCRFTALE